MNFSLIIALVLIGLSVSCKHQESTNVIVVPFRSNNKIISINFEKVILEGRFQNFSRNIFNECLSYDGINSEREFTDYSELLKKFITVVNEYNIPVKSKIEIKDKNILITTKEKGFSSIQIILPSSDSYQINVGDSCENKKMLTQEEKAVVKLVNPTISYRS